MAPVAPDIETYPASSFDFDTLIRAFNEGYTGYHVPVQVDAHELRHHIEQNDIDLDISLLACREDQVVGAVLFATRGSQGWIGGLGVHPDHRRQGVARALMQAVIDDGRARRLTTLQLEVIDGNTAAHKLYRDLGFTEKRRLFVLGCQSPQSSDEHPVPFTAAVIDDALRLHLMYHLSPTAWQRSYGSLTRTDASAKVWVTPDTRNPSAYAVGFASASMIHLLDLACAPGQESALQGLISTLQARNPGAAGRIVNVGEDESGWRVLSALRWNVILTQYEMTLHL